MKKKLKNLLKNLDYEVISGSISDLDIDKISYDTRSMQSNDIFVCLKGARFDSHSEIEKIIDAKIKVIVVDQDNTYINDYLNKKNIPDNVLILGVKNTRMALAILSANYFDNPAQKLTIIGITGTKGKTTTAFMIKKIIEESGHKVGMIGTIGIFYENNHIITDNTTPESYTINEYFKKMLDAGIDFVVMEVSSQSLKYHRVYGLTFDFVVWTNIMVDHIGENEHENYEDYLNSKLKIFTMCKSAVVNSSTNEYDKVIDAIKKNNVMLFEKKENKHFDLKIPGFHNQENASLAYTVAKAMNIDDVTIKKALSETIVPGRIEEVYSSDEFKVIVDFSYEENGAKKLFETLKADSNHRIVAVFGCGGNRSKDRRYGMGRVAGTMANFVILTADNSRYEKTRDIIKDIESTLVAYKKEGDLENGYIVIEDRREAIKYAIKNHKIGDIICVMGKGHEPLMEMNGEHIKFLDREVICEILKDENYI